MDANGDQEPDVNGGIVELGAAIAEALTSSNRTAAAAESLTGGNVSAALIAIKGASDWFLGGVVAYAEQVKFDLLRVDRGPVINARSARQMAAGVARLLGADCAVATTGVGGPGPQETFRRARSSLPCPPRRAPGHVHHEVLIGRARQPGRDCGPGSPAGRLP